MYWDGGWGGPVPLKVPLNVISMADVICNYRPLLMPVNFKAMLFRPAAIYLHKNNSELYEGAVFKVLKFLKSTVLGNVMQCHLKFDRKILLPSLVP
jgi:hypothetical protein